MRIIASSRAARRALLVGSTIAALAALAAPPCSMALAASRPPDDPDGATVRIASTRVAPGQPVAFTGTGFTATAGGGQVVTVKIDDGQVAGTFTADSAGDVSGSVTAPVTPGAHWLRFLTGSGGSNGQGGGAQPPARSLTADFTVVALSSGVGGPSRTAQAVLRSHSLIERGGRLAVRLACAHAACWGSVRVRTAQPVTLGERHTSVTIAGGTYRIEAATSTTLSLALTRDGHRLLSMRHALRVLVRVTVKDGKTRSAVLTLTRG